MTLSVIVPTKDREEDLLITLRSLLRQIRPPEELIIIDQSQENSREKIIKIMSDIPVRVKYVWDRQISSQTEARIIGLREAVGDIVFFLDDDVTLDEYCIENLLRTYKENPHLGGICAVDTAVENMGLPRLLMTSLFNCGPFSGKTGGWFYTDLLIHHFNRKLKGFYYTWAFFGGFMSFKRRVVEEIGFDEKLKGDVFAEDIDLAFRVSKKYPLALVPKVKVLHREGKPLYSLEWAFKRRVLAKRYFFTKNVEKTPFNILCFLWALLGLFISTTISALLYRSLDPVRGFLSAMKGTSVADHAYLSEKRC